MCGIFGFSLKVSDALHDLKKMGDTMVHRGPDGEGFYYDDNINMGMRRLSIIDIEHGNQPFYSEDKSVVVFCNGEIYNYKELKNKLIKKGYTFNTNSDVEVIPHLYHEYGIEFIDLLNGIFAISIYDKKTERLFLIRDRLGVKPLYYSIIDNDIIYSSEIKPILSLNTIDKKIDFDALSTYLDLMYIPQPMTPFKNIKKLEVGTFLQWEKDTGVFIKRYWDLQLQKSDKKEQEHYSEMSSLLDDSCKLQLISDVPVGSFLSGGVDSSFVTANSARLSEKRLFVFHMRWKKIEGKIDESEYAEKVADLYNVNKVFKDVNNIDVLKILPKLIYYLEEPFADAAFIPTYYLSNIAKDNVKVILSGAGGDELFGGYSHHKEYGFLESMARKILLNKNPRYSYYDRWKRGKRGQWRKIFPWYKEDYFKKDFENLFHANKKTDKINATMLNDIKYYLCDDILFLTDKMTMATSIECRVPLLDHRIVEKAQTIPSEMKIKNGEKKYMFKKIAEQIVPKEVLYRKKEGFGFPIEKWINQNKKDFDNLILHGCLLKNHLINKRNIEHFTNVSSLTKKESWFYWQIIVLEIWYKIFVSDQNYQNDFPVFD